MGLPAASEDASSWAWRDGGWTRSVRTVAEESAVALTYNRISHAVMMATPSDLEDFATGFSLSEGIVGEWREIEELELVPVEGGAVECRMWIAAASMAALETRRRRIAGVTGCGMCGLESLSEAMRPVPAVPEGRTFTADQIIDAVGSIVPAQTLGRATRAVHAAGFWTPEAGLVVLREDVGRHNALDKLGGAMARKGLRAEAGIVVMTSRLSVELVQKAARMSAPLVAGVSAPTALALRNAREAGMTLVGVARADGFEVLTHPRRIDGL
jgi:FdhD protein